MTPEQLALLLTTARILRAWAHEGEDAGYEDYLALDDALRPFEPLPHEPTNEANQ